MSLYYEIFIPNNVPSLKNNKVLGKFHSKTVRQYLRSFNIIKMDVNANMYERIKCYKGKPNLFYRALEPYFRILKEKYPNSLDPLICQLHFVRSTKREFDFNNASQIICDLFTSHSFIKDDSMKYLICVPYKKEDKWYSVDPQNPGVYIKLIVKT